jgi:thiol-disulfide isomerase/thioredoxin
MTPPERHERTLRIAGAILVVLIGVWAGARVYSTRIARGSAAASGTPAVQTPVGEASPPTTSDFDQPFDTPPAAAKIPDRLPEFSLAGPDGRPTAIAHWAGKSLILNFWATWCAPCRREIPLLKALNTEWSGRGVAVVGVAVDYRDKVMAYAEELKIPYALLIGEQDALDVAAQLGIDTPAFPFTVFTDNRGDVVTLYLGELHRAQADLILSVVRDLNDNRLELAQARRTIADGLHALTPERAG